MRKLICLFRDHLKPQPFRVFHILWVRNLDKEQFGRCLHCTGQRQRRHTRWTSLQHGGGVIPISAGRDGRLASAETLHCSTCYKGSRADLLSGSSGLEKQCSCRQARNCMSFSDLASEAPRGYLLSYLTGTEWGQAHLVSRRWTLF